MWVRYGGGEAVGTTVIYQGEKVKDNNKVVAYKTGGKFTQNISFDYVPGMKKSKLFLTFKAKVGKKEIQIPEIEIAQGTIVTATLANPSEIAGATGADAFQRVIQEKYEAAISFQIQRAELQKKALTTAEIAALQAQLLATQQADNKQIASLGIAAYASPDGPTDLNEKLAANRKKNTEGFLGKELKKSKIETTVDAKFIAEDWDGFQKLMENSNIQDKQVILRVLSVYTDPEQREREIKNLSVAFKSIADEILPQLRRSRLKLTVDVTGKSDAEIAKLAKEDAAKLTKKVRLLHRDGVSGNYSFLEVGISAGGFYYFDGERDTNNENWANLTSSVTADLGWHHFVITSSGTTDTLYVDGILQTSSTRTGASTTVTVHSIGRGYGSSSNNYGDFFKGFLSEFRIYSTALSLS